MTGLAGSENFLINLGEGLHARNWEPYFGLIEEKGNPVDETYRKLMAAGWNVERFSYREGFLLSLWPRIKRWIRTVQPALIHTHLIHADLLGAFTSIGMDTPFVTSKHNDDQFKHYPGYGWFAGMLNRAFDRGITISHHLNQFYTNELRIDQPDFETIHYGLDVDEFLSVAEPRKPSRDNGPTTFGIVARLVEQKGHTTLLEAFHEVIKDTTDVQLKIVGDGPLLEEFKQLTQQLDIDKWVSFEGHKKDIPNVMRNFDVFVHPSRWEGFGLVFLEAMACKLPVIATDVSAIPEIVVDGETGILVPPDESDRLAEAMIELKENQSLRSTMGGAGYERVRKNFSIEKMIDQHVHLYEELMAD